MILNYKLERLVEKHAKKNNITKEQALEIVSIYFANIREKIAEGSSDNIESFVEIYVPKMGTFLPNYKQIKKVDEVTKARKQQPL